MLIIYNDICCDDDLNYRLEKMKDIIDKAIEDEKELSEIDFYSFIKEISELDPFTNIDKVVYYLIDYILITDEKEIYKEVEVVETMLYYYDNIRNSIV